MITTAGSTNKSVYFYIVQDASATSPGEPVTGLLFSDIETGGSASYVRQGAARTDLTLITLASASAPHADGGFILVDDTNMPGLYRCDYPDAAFATGVDQVMLQIVVASGKNAVASPIFVEITDVDLRDSVRGGMTALPNAAADGIGGLPISDAGGLDLDAKLANTNEVTAVRMAALTDWINGGRLDLLLDAIPTTAMRGTDGANTTAPDNASIAAILVDTAVIGAAGVGLTNITINSASVDLIWDESLSGHNVGGSSGKTLKTIPSTIIRQAMAQGPGTGNNQIQLDTGASAVDGTFDPSLVFISDGTGVGQCRNILEYNGTTKTATVDRNWKINPDVTSEFLILADAGREHVNEGLAQAGTANTITLNTLASSTNDVYIGQIVFIRSGTGDDQVGTVIAYNGTTKVATVHRNWSIVPDSTSAYVMLPSSPVELTDNTIGFILTKQMTEAYAADGTAPTLTEALMLIQQSLHEFAIAGTTRTVKKLDGAATAATFTLDDATNPTSTTRAT